MAFQRKKPAGIGAKAPFPGFVEPALATSIERVPSGQRWIHEIKFDGYRVQVQASSSSIPLQRHHLVNEDLQQLPQPADVAMPGFYRCCAPS